MFVIVHRAGRFVLNTRHFSAASAETYLYRQYEPGRWDSPWDYEVRRQTWQERENDLFAKGIYTRPVWADEKFWTAHAGVHAEHFAHVSLDDETMLAFTEDAGKGERNRQTRMKPGRYLKRYFGDVLTDRQIAFYAEWWEQGSRPVEKIDGEFGLATDPDEIERIYAEGPQSCMKGDDYVRVYGAGDLAVAYLESEDLGVFARALCWPEKKVFGRVYPTPGDDEERAQQQTLFNRLKAEGYTHFQEGGSFDGARLLREPASRSFVMPYLDGGYGVDDEGEFLIMRRGGGEFDCERTDGTCDPEYSHACDECGEGVDDVYTVYRDYNAARGWAIGEQSWCEDCRDSSAFYCEATQDYYDEGTTSGLEVDGQTWVESYAYANAFQCEHSGEWFPLGCMSERFHGYHADHDDDASVHPEIEEEELEAA